MKSDTSNEAEAMMELFTTDPKDINKLVSDKGGVRSKVKSLSISRN
jgi:hypothetical protein